MSIAAALILVFSSPDSTKIELSTSIEDQYFMCPVLTPRLRERLIRNCECEVVSTEDYKIWLYPNEERPFAEKRIRELIDLVGFDTTHVTIQHVKD